MEVAWQIVVNILIDVGFLTLVILHISDSFLFFKRIGKVEECPIALIWAILKFLNHVELSCFLIVQVCITIGWVNVRFLVNECCKRSVSQHFSILLDLLRVDRYSKQTHHLLLSKSSVKLSPTGNWVLLWEQIFGFFIFYFLPFIISLESYLRNLDIKINSVILIEDGLLDPV